MRPASRNATAPAAHSPLTVARRRLELGMNEAASAHLQQRGNSNLYLRRRATLAGSLRGAAAHMAVSLICAVIAGCGPSTGPEEAVRLWVNDAQTAAENGDRGALMAMIADSYADARGNDKADIEQMLRIWFLRNRSIVLASKIDNVTILGGTAATVLLTAGMAGTGDGTFGISADAWRFELELAGDGEDWRLIGARWGELGGELR